VPDLRVLTQHIGKTATEWYQGQKGYEVVSRRAAERHSEYYASQRRGVEEVYEAIPIIGRCLDVGGNDGRLRTFLQPDQEYVIVDPFIGVLDEPRSDEFKRIYSSAGDPLNFICALAEHLPLCTETFDTVHMRSVIDHFSNPELALREAYRVLKVGGSLVLGLYVEGGQTGRERTPYNLSGMLGSVLGLCGFSRFKDHHIWHPTYQELRGLIEASGFSVIHTHWQKSEQNRVCYIKAGKG
jgi:SAM-dependent methyltransferase